MLVFIYMILAYWAVGRTIFRNKVLIGSWTAIIMKKMIVGFFLGIILIPWAILTVFMGSDKR